MRELRRPRRPQAYRAGYAHVRQRAQCGVCTWHFCLAALALLTFATVVANSRSAIAAPVPAEPVDLVARTEAGGTKLGGRARSLLMRRYGFRFLPWTSPRWPRRRWRRHWSRRRHA
jgi:hypothetical protein